MQARYLVSSRVIYAGVFRSTEVSGQVCICTFAQEVSKARRLASPTSLSLEYPSFVFSLIATSILLPRAIVLFSLNY